MYETKNNVLEPVQTNEKNLVWVYKYRGLETFYVS